ncbi:MAG: glucose-1-phosphate cytidylyltransferase [Candidatus Aureabacteria bacterium]|nr:glucose-1-phosphate cytidylyltransferase [Candidatus Auribacterota bacterium]
MKVVILAGGVGSRLSEETELKPKPMIEIGGKPILWHIMKIYSHYGFNDFIICLGYKGYIVKEYFSNYFLHLSDVTIDLAGNKMDIHGTKAEPWRVTLIDTGATTQTGGRIKKIQKYVGDETFMLTYGDGVAKMDIPELLAFHKKHGKFATVTAVQPRGRFGAIGFGSGDQVTAFQEKPKGEGGWISGGFFVLEPEIFGYIDGDAILWEREPLAKLAQDGQLAAFKHSGFWKPMDTLRDRRELEELWFSGAAEWKIWDE